MPVPEFLFTASCDQHDFNYWLGGDEAARLKADREFYAAMRKDAGMNPFYQAMALTYYLAVRSCGSFCFHYGQERDEDDLAAVMLGGEA